MSRCALGAALLLLSSSVPTSAQHLGPSSGGLGALDQALRFLGHHKRVLMIGAHPDDEDTEFLTVVVRGMGAEAAYLSLTRGEGGQNLIGSELGPALGVLRTEELLAARQLDGARQFFTRAYDFGYSKTLADTWRFWSRDSVLKDVVRVLRSFRPHVVVSVFSGTPRDGHGQHQAAGWVAHEAFRLAGDPGVFPELAREEGLRPWTPLKLYRSARLDPGQATLVLAGGQLDLAVGQSFRQIAMRGRSLHRSQDMGAAQPIGPSAVRLQLVEDRTGAGAGGLFAGVDTSFASLLERDLTAAERRVADSIGDGLRALRAWAPQDLPRLRVRFLTLLGPTSPVGPAARDQLRRMQTAEFLASRVLCDALAETEYLIPGLEVSVVLSCWNASPDTVRATAQMLYAGRAAGDLRRWLLAPGELAADTLRWLVPEAEAPTQPYFLSRPRLGGLYDWPAGSPAGEPFEPDPLAVEFQVGGGVQVREVVHRVVDQALGEIRRPVRVTPRVSIALEPSRVVWPIGDSSPRSFAVTLRHWSRRPTAGQVQLVVPQGWRTDPPTAFTLDRLGATVTRQFTVHPPTGAGPGEFTIAALAEDQEGGRYSRSVTTIEYPHIRPRQVVEPAQVKVVLAPVALPAVPRVGYVRGAADAIPEILAGLGFDVVLLGADSLARGDLSRFPTVVVGPRAYEIEPALTQHHERLMAYVRDGGTLIVQYQQQMFFAGGYAPNPLRLTDAASGPAFRAAAPRVAEEDAAVRVLDPTHPILTRPNRLGPDDWQGWIQERGLYFARSWSEAWTPLLEMADSGEPPLRGALLVSRVGEGAYVYTGLSFFRQLPAGVPGAVRLFVNLLAFAGADRAP
jgi:LmbE family N-acetylglucosaminyl deacetylase